MRLLFQGLPAGTLLMTAPENLFQAGGKFLEFLETTFMIGVLVWHERLLEYLRLPAGFYEVKPYQRLISDRGSQLREGKSGQKETGAEF